MKYEELQIKSRDALDWQDRMEMLAQSQKVSEITKLYNTWLSHYSSFKYDILEECSKFPDENLHKLSFDNKCVRLMALNPQLKDMIVMLKDAESFVKRLKNKKDQMQEHLYALKKIEGDRP